MIYSLLGSASSFGNYWWVGGGGGGGGAPSLILLHIDSQLIVEQLLGSVRIRGVA